MKVNVNDGPNAWKHRVYLDGVIVNYVIEADEEAGYILAAKQQEGKLIYGADQEPIIERREGVVRIEPHEQQL